MMRARCQPMGSVLQEFESRLLEEEYEENRKEFNSDAHLKEVVKWLKGKGRPSYTEIAERLECGDLLIS